MSTKDTAGSVSLPVPKIKLPRRDRFAPYYFISPFYALFAVFFLFPSVAALVLGFLKWNSLGTPTWFGLRNYDHLFKDEVFWLAVRNTVLYCIASLAVVMPLALIEAMALNSKQLKLRTLWRAVYFAPIVTSSVAISLVFRMLYNTDYGLLNGIITSVGGTPVDWLGSQNVVKISVMGVVVWRWTGLLAVYFLAGLQSIPEDLYEAAAIDGASAWDRFWNITLPSLRPIILFVSIIVLTGSLQIFDDPQILFGNTTPGGPGNAGYSVVQYLYNRGIQKLLYGYASAVGLFLFTIIFVLSLVQFRAFRGFESD